ncbi:MAG: histidine kinase [Burkholderiales bacterium]|nr:histidine kinase [Burkholderiales bacterium]
MLPNFRNVGVMLRILLIVNLLCFLAAFLRSGSWAELMREWADISSVSQLLLLASLLFFALLDDWLHELPYFVAATVLFFIEMLLAAIAHWFGESFHYGSILHYWVFSLLTVSFLLWYFNLRNRALSPALAEARLQALQARIRPHFLFNSINAVLSLIRSDPSRAETALEDLADMFRVLMADNRKLTTLTKEVELCREYLDLETLRLGDRLQVQWHIDKMPGDAMIPPLVLQPLLENAVYHGIEPSSSPGAISIHIYRRRGEIHAVLRNPYSPGGRGHHEGNKMALENIRERLSLHFDVEASLKTELVGNVFQVHIVLPYISEADRHA